VVESAGCSDGGWLELLAEMGAIATRPISTVAQIEEGWLW